MLNDHISTSHPVKNGNFAWPSFAVYLFKQILLIVVTVVARRTELTELKPS